MTHEAVNESPAASGRIEVVGIVGGVGSGKSSVARWVATQANVHVIDADQLGHEALMDSGVKTSLRVEFGDDIFDVQGEVQRKALARRVFGDTEAQRGARRALEKIVHPEIERRIVAEIRRAADAGCVGVLLDAAVLLEVGWQRQCDTVVFIETPDEIRLQRVWQRSGWSAEELRKREASQLSLAEKRKQSDAIIFNSGQVFDAGQQLLNFLRGCGIFGCKLSPESSQQLSIASE